jgi:hypothetical protein
MNASPPPNEYNGIKIEMKWWVRAYSFRIHYNNKILLELNITVMYEILRLRYHNTTWRGDQANQCRNLLQKPRDQDK